MLSFEELRADVEVGRDRHRRRRLHRHAGAPDRASACTPSSSSRRWTRGTGWRGATTCSRSRWRWIPVPGYAIASWEQGYGDFDVRPDLATLRRIPWLEATALVLGDVQWHDGSPVQPSPRQVLKAQMERAAALGFTPMMGSELEFYLLRETFAEAHAKGYSRLTPSVPYILDYHILATTYDEPFLRADPQRDAGRRHARRDLEGRGVAGPAGDQLPLRRRADDGRQPRRSTRTAPRRSRSSTAARSRSWRSRSRTGSATPATSTRRSGATATPCFATDEALFSRWLAGPDRVLQGARDLPRADDQLVQALRGRLVGADDARVGERQPHLRVPGRRPRGGAPRRDAHPGRRREPVPRVRRRDRGRAARDRAASSSCRPALEGNAYESDAERFPSTMREAVAALEEGAMARAAFGDQVVDHYLNYARTEQAALRRASSPTGSGSATSSAADRRHRPRPRRPAAGEA